MIGAVLKKKVVFFLTFMLLVLAFVFVLVFRDEVKHAVKNTITQEQYMQLLHMQREIKSLFRFEQIITNKINHNKYDGYFADLDVPSVDLFISDFNYRELSNARKAALKSGLILNKEWYKADLYYQVDGVKGKAKVKIRLKGDADDHLKDPYKWSFRVNMKGEKRFLGAKKFAINGIHTRGGSMQYLLTNEKIRLDILTPRLVPVKVSINGVNRGIMFFQEHFSKELVEAGYKTRSRHIRV